MDGGSRAYYWNRLYGSGNPVEHSWFEPHARRSLRLIRETGVPADSPILDVGSGASVLPDDLLRAGYTDLTVVDVAPAALARSRARLGRAAERVRWIAADVTALPSTRRYAVWHDRAVLHFLLDPREQEQYVSALRSALAPCGHVILATFGPEGPTRCSGLGVKRYSTAMLAALLGEDFVLRDSVSEDHYTPRGVAQQFLYSRWQANA